MSAAPVPAEIERVVCERTRTRSTTTYESFYAELRLDGMFLVRARIKKDVYEWLRDKGVKAIVKT